jgi:hypothetical protein
VLDDGSKGLFGRLDKHHDGRTDARLPQRKGLIHGGYAQHGHAFFDRPLRSAHKPMPVTVRFDDGHNAATLGDAVADGLQVLCVGVEIDDGA